MRRYHYAVLPARDVQKVLSPDPTTDLHVPSEWVTASLRSLLACGYRWIRTDGAWAVFEREDSAPPVAPGPPGAPLWEVSNRPAQPANRRRLTVRASSSSAAVEGVKRILGGTWYARRLDVLADSVKADYDFSLSVP